MEFKESPPDRFLILAIISALRVEIRSLNITSCDTSLCFCPVMQRQSPPVALCSAQQRRYLESIRLLIHIRPGVSQSFSAFRASSLSANGEDRTGVSRLTVSSGWTLMLSGRRFTLTSHRSVPLRRIKTKKHWL